jgi:hypothetical protein
MKKSILLLVISFMSIFAYAEWELCSPEGGNIYSIITKGNVLFMGTQFGVYKSNDGGNTWQLSNDGLTTLIVHVLFVKDDSILAGTNGGGIFVTTDDAGNWSSINNGLTGTMINAIVENDFGLFAGTNDAGVFVSSDNGSSWSAVNNGISNTTIKALVTMGNKLIAGTDGAGVFSSANNGQSWTAMNNGLSSWFIRSLYSLNNMLFAGTHAGLYRLDENSTYFTEITGNFYANVLSYSFDGTFLYIGTDCDGVFYSDNFGDDWTEWNDGLINKNIYSLGIFGNDIYAGCCCGYGLWKRLLHLYTGINKESRQFSVSIYPNPAKSFLTIEFTDRQMNLPCEIMIYDQAGKMVLQQGTVQNSSVIEVNCLTPGHYIARIADKDQAVHLKFEIAR